MSGCTLTWRSCWSDQKSLGTIIGVCCFFARSSPQTGLTIACVSRQTDVTALSYWSGKGLGLQIRQSIPAWETEMAAFEAQEMKNLSQMAGAPWVEQLRIYIGCSSFFLSCKLIFFPALCFFFSSGFHLWIHFLSFSPLSVHTFSLCFFSGVGQLEYIHLSAPFVAVKNKEVNLTVVLWPSQVGTVTYIWWFGNNSEVLQWLFTAPMHQNANSSVWFKVGLILNSGSKKTGRTKTMK